MASTSQKLNYATTDDRVARRQADGRVHNVSKRLPVSVVKIDKTNSIITLKFETDGMPYTLPNVTVPLSGPEYIRYPIKPAMMMEGQSQPGDFGYVTSADSNIGNMSGLGPMTPANFTAPANLAPLIFTLMGNKNWTPHDDQTALMGYAPTGTIHRDTSKKAKHVVHPSNGITTQTGAQGETGPTSNPTYNMTSILHPMNGLLHTILDSDNGTHMASIIPKGGSGGPIGWLLSMFGGKHTHSVGTDGHSITSDKNVNVTSKQTNITGSSGVNLNGGSSGVNVQSVLNAIGGMFSGGGGGGGGGAGSSGGISASGAVTGSSVAATGQIAGASVAAIGLVTGATVQTMGFTVAALNLAYPPASNAGMRAYVTDAPAPTFLSILSGGGSVICPAFCNGTHWIAG